MKMFLSIYGIPLMFSRDEIKKLIKRESNLHAFSLEDLVQDKKGAKRVKIGVADEAEGNLLVTRLNGFRIKGNTLRVTPYAKPKKQQQNNFIKQQQKSGPKRNNVMQNPGGSGYQAGHMGQALPQGNQPWTPSKYQWRADQQPKPQNNNGVQQGANQASPQQKVDNSTPNQKVQAEKRKLDTTMSPSASATKKPKTQFNSSPMAPHKPYPKGYIPPPRGKGGIPLFAMPCKHLLRQMRPVMCKYTRGKELTAERRLLKTFIRAHLRRTLTLMIDDRGYLPTADIMRLYREQNPVEGDDAFVMQMLDDIRVSFWPFPGARQRRMMAEGKKAKIKKKAVTSETVVKSEPGTDPTGQAVPNTSNVIPEIADSSKIINQAQSGNVIEQTIKSEVNVESVGVTEKPDHTVEQSESNNDVTVGDKESTTNTDQVVTTADTEQGAPNSVSSAETDKSVTDSVSDLVVSTAETDRGVSDSLSDQIVSDQVVSDPVVSIAETDQGVSNPVSDPVVLTAATEQVASTSVTGQNITNETNKVVAQEIKPVDTVEQVTTNKDMEESQAGEKNKCVDAVNLSEASADQQGIADEDDWITNGVDWNDDDDEDGKDQSGRC